MRTTVWQKQAWYNSLVKSEVKEIRLCLLLFLSTWCLECSPQIIPSSLIKLHLALQASLRPGLSLQTQQDASRAGVSMSTAVPRGSIMGRSAVRVLDIVCETERCLQANYMHFSKLSAQQWEWVANFLIHLFNSFVVPANIPSCRTHCLVLFQSCSISSQGR